MHQDDNVILVPMRRGSINATLLHKQCSCVEMRGMSQSPSPSQLADRIRALGARATPARVAVMRLLESSAHALSHHDIESALADSGFDRVTLYRVLDWLVETGLAHRVADGQRVFRFSAAQQAAQHTAHAHFRCDDCGRVFCLEDVSVAEPRLPQGFVGRAIDFNVSGHCAQCRSGAAATPRQYKKKQGQQ
ncbi:Fur family transcriptional regulator [Uliginosibacterium sp. sgz301328]|uniref:Fur family transcriptional regulator n=1 Tax=Uliginosibacterium sp. sgz301328 TaxID=3243764 RepID=UPI00359E586A